jgi:predicted  nucleic acid-binding Zn-ribbon protein
MSFRTNCDTEQLQVGSPIIKLSIKIKVSTDNQISMMMIQVTSADIRELKDLIQGFEKKVELEFSDLKGEIRTINSRLSNLETTAAKLPDLAEKVGELKNWKQIAIVVFTATISGSIAWFVHGSGK